MKDLPGMCISAEKSGFYIGSKAERRASHITRITGISRRDFSFNYLGVPMFIGRPKIIYFEHMVDKVRKAIDGWKARVLSFGGPLTLIKSVLLSFPIYTLASSMWCLKQSSVELIDLWRNFYEKFVEKVELVG